MRCPPGVELIEVLGAGSVFEVARVRFGDATCILKRVRRSLRGNERALSAMKRESGALELGNGRVMPALIASAEDEAGPYLLEEELLETSIKDLIERGEADRRPDVFEPLFLAVFTALAHFHAIAPLLATAAPCGLVHGDLGPDHVVYDLTCQRARFLDFGLARWRAIDPAWLAPDERGTLPFVAPELARAEVCPDQPCDVFALAATYAFAALGRAPCRGTTSSARLIEAAERGIDSEAIDSCARLPHRIRAALIEALRFDRGERRTTANAVLAAAGLGG